MYPKGEGAAPGQSGQSIDGVEEKDGKVAEVGPAAAGAGGNGDALKGQQGGGPGNEQTDQHPEQKLRPGAFAAERGLKRPGIAPPPGR